MYTNGSNCGATSRSLAKNAARDIVSYALRPSSDTNTASLCVAKAARTWAASASVPAGSNVAAHCLASVLDTRRRNTSPVAMPRTPPSGLRNAVRRAIASAGGMSAGTRACASCVAASARSSMAVTSCNRSFRCSARMPERPGAPPRRAERRADATARALRWIGWAGWCESSSGGTSVRGTGGRRVGSVSAAQVAPLPGASSAAVSTWRALETSPL